MRKHDDVRNEEENESSEHFKIYEETATRNLTFYLSDEVHYSTLEYSDMLYTLDKQVKSEDVVEIRMSNFGGAIHAGLRLAHAIKNCRGTTIVHMEAPCYSMGAIIALSGDALVMYPGAFLMFHNYSTIRYGKGNEFTMAIEALNRHVKRVDEYFCSPFLSKAELRNIQNDQDVYIYDDDKDIKQRMKRHFKRMEFDTK